MSPHQPVSSDPAPGQPPGSVLPNPRLWSRRNMRRLYDILVTHGTYWAMWGCPWKVVAALYAEAIGPQATVLEIGPGSGFFLDQLDRPKLKAVHLLDLHEGSLQASRERLARYQPVTHRHNALEPFPLEEGSVDAAVLSMVLHCLPGNSIVDKAPVFDNVAAVLPPGGVCIGSTVLAHGVPVNPLGRAGLRYLNTQNVFHNSGDTLTDLAAVLHDRFDDVRLAVSGSVALWQVSAR